jgi:hypothetical protein
MRRFAFGVLVCLTAFVVCGCAGTGSSDSVRTFSQKDAGNIAATDSLGASLWQQRGVQTAFVPGEN